VSSMSLAGSRARGQIIDARNSQIVWFSSSGWRLRPLERAHGWSACGARPKDRAVASQVSKRSQSGSTLAQALHSFAQYCSRFPYDLRLAGVGAHRSAGTPGASAGVQRGGQTPALRQWSPVRASPRWRDAMGSRRVFCSVGSRSWAAAGAPGRACVWVGHNLRRRYADPGARPWPRAHQNGPIVGLYARRSALGWTRSAGRRLLLLQSRPQSGAPRLSP
jgi:hypothetical protein